MFTLTVFEILLFEDKSVLGPAQRFPGSEMAKCSIKNQKNVQLLLELLEKWLPWRFQMIFMVFFVLFNPFSTGKIEKLNFGDSKSSTNFQHQ